MANAWLSGRQPDDPRAGPPRVQDRAWRCNFGSDDGRSQGPVQTRIVEPSLASFRARAARLPRGWPLDSVVPAQGGPGAWPGVAKQVRQCLLGQPARAEPGVQEDGRRGSGLPDQHAGPRERGAERAAARKSLRQAV